MPPVQQCLAMQFIKSLLLLNLHSAAAALRPSEAVFLSVVTSNMQKSSHPYYIVEFIVFLGMTGIILQHPVQFIFSGFLFLSHTTATVSAHSS